MSDEDISDNEYDDNDDDDDDDDMASDAGDKTCRRVRQPDGRKSSAEGRMVRSKIQATVTRSRGEIFLRTGRSLAFIILVA